MYWTHCKNNGQVTRREYNKNINMLTFDTRKDSEEGTESYVFFTVYQPFLGHPKYILPCKFFFFCMPLDIELTIIFRITKIFSRYKFCKKFGKYSRETLAKLK